MKPVPLVLLLCLALPLPASEPVGAEEAHAATAPGLEAASATVESLHAGLLQAMQGGESLGFEGRYRILEPVVAEAYDLDFMAAKTLGRHWSKLDEAQQGRWRQAFAQLTVSTYADRFHGFAGERFETLGSAAAARNTALVKTRIHPTEDPPVPLDYRLRLVDGSYRIIDVYLNGTVSELALRRSDYSSLLKREGFAELLRAIEAKIAEAEAGTRKESG